MKKTQPKTDVAQARKAYARKRRLAHFGMVENDYKAMLEKQGGVCAICKRPPTGRNLDIDHEHQKNEKSVSPESRKERVRLLLCHRCNRALGMFGNKTETLAKIAENFLENMKEIKQRRKP